MRAVAAPRSRQRRVLTADAAMAVVVLLLGLFLSGTGASLIQRWGSSPVRHQSPGFEDQLGIAANTAGLIVIAWWAMSLAIAAAAAFLERSGNVGAASAAGKFAPAYMRRLALAAVGLELLTAPLAAASTAPPVPGATAASAASAASAAWTPTAVPAATGTRAAPYAAAPVPTPQPGTPAEAPSVANPGWRPLSPVVEPGPLAGRPLRHQPPADQASEVTVRPGDSLWSLSASRLGPFASDVDIALDWPRLYQANRDIIGGDPHLIRPGQVLKLPPGP